MLNVIDELEELKENLKTVGSSLDTPNLTGHVQRISAIIGTAGDRKANRKLIAALSELHLEITEEFPHMPTIEYLVHLVMKRFYEAVGSHYENWEEIRQSTINKALGSHAVLNEPRLFRPSFLAGIRKKRQLENQQKYLEDQSEFDDDDFDMEDDEFDDDI